MTEKITYTVALTIVRSAGDPARDEDVAESVVWMQTAEARRQLEKEVLHVLRKLDGECDCEVLEATRS